MTGKAPCFHSAVSMFRKGTCPRPANAAYGSRECPRASNPLQSPAHRHPIEYPPGHGSSPMRATTTQSPSIAASGSIPSMKKEGIYCGSIFGALPPFACGTTAIEVDCSGSLSMLHPLRKIVRLYTFSSLGGQAILPFQGQNRTGNYIAQEHQDWCRQ